MNSEKPFESLHVAVPALFSVRPFRNLWLVPAGKLIPPLALNAPAPLRVPPIQVNNPLTVILPVPEIVPELLTVSELVTVEVPAISSDPLEIVRLIVLVSELICCAPEESVTPVPVFIHTSSVGPGKTRV